MGALSELLQREQQSPARSRKAQCYHRAGWMERSKVQYTDIRVFVLDMMHPRIVATSVMHKIVMRSAKPCEYVHQRGSPCETVGCIVLVCQHITETVMLTMTAGMHETSKDICCRAKK